MEKQVYDDYDEFPKDHWWIDARRDLLYKLITKTQSPERLVSWTSDAGLDSTTRC